MATDSHAPRLVHIVLFKFKEASTSEQIASVFNALMALKAKISVILDISVGKNITDRSKGYTHAITVLFKDEADLKVYADHPEHQAVIKELILPIKDDILAVDYVENSF